MNLNWNFQRGGGGVQPKTPSVGGLWIFSGTTQCNAAQNWRAGITAIAL